MLVLPDMFTFLCLIAVAICIGLLALSSGSGVIGFWLIFIVVMTGGLVLMNDPSTIHDPNRNVTIEVMEDRVDSYNEDRWNGKFYTSVESNAYYVRDKFGDVYKTKSLDDFNILNKKGVHKIYTRYQCPFEIENVYS